MNQICECSDPGCIVHKGTSSCEMPAELILYRSDMEDRTGTVFCDACSSDAMDAGVFDTEPNFYSV